MGAAVQGGRWIPVSALGAPTFGGFSHQQAGLAYLQSYALVDAVVRYSSEGGLRQFVAELLRSGRVDRALQRGAGLRVPVLERDLLAELGA